MMKFLPVPKDRFTMLSIARLQSSSDFQRFKQYVEQVSEELKAKSAELRGDIEVRWNQGHQQAVLDFLDLFANAHDWAANMDALARKQKTR